MSTGSASSPVESRLRVTTLPAADILCMWHRVSRALEAVRNAAPLPEAPDPCKDLLDGIETFLETLIPLCTSDPRMSRVARRRQARHAQHKVQLRDHRAAPAAPGLDKAFGELCAGCGALGPGPAAAPFKARLTHLALQALPGCRDPETTMHLAMSSREAPLIRATADHFPWQAGWTRIAYGAPEVGPGTLAHELNLECLDALCDIDVALVDALDIVATQAISRDRADALDWLDQVPGWKSKTPWPNKHLRTRIMSCGPGCAGHLRCQLDDRITQTLSQGAEYALYRGLFPRSNVKTRHFDLKVFAALLSSRRDITRVFCEPGQNLHPHLENLLKMTTSAHGQLLLQTLEPDPVTLLGRPSSAEFFGINGEQFHLGRHTDLSSQDT